MVEKQASNVKFLQQSSKLQSLGANERVANQHQVGQRAETTRHRGKKRRQLFDTVEIDIPHNLPFNGINISIQNYRPWLYHTGGNAGRLPHAHDVNICIPGYAGEVLGTRVAERSCGVTAATTRLC